MLDIRAAAEHLGTSERHMRRLVADRRITFVKVGGRIRFRRADLEKFIEANTVAAVQR